MVSNPRLTGAVAPSSARLANRVAEVVRPYESVLELGAGTGAITRALQGCGIAQLEVTELQENLVRGLKKRYTGLRVKQACATEAIADFVPDSTPAIVSSLPFKSLPSAVHAATVETILEFLHAHRGAILVQYTYGLSVPFQAPPQYQWHRIAWVLANLPPACVWVLTLAGQPVGCSPTSASRPALKTAESPRLCTARRS